MKTWASTAVKQRTALGRPTVKSLCTVRYLWFFLLSKKVDFWEWDICFVKRWFLDILVWFKRKSWTMTQFSQFILYEIFEPKFVIVHLCAKVKGGIELNLNSPSPPVELRRKQTRRQTNTFVGTAKCQKSRQLYIMSNGMPVYSKINKKSWEVGALRKAKIVKIAK